MQNTLEQQTARRSKVQAEIADMQAYVDSAEYTALPPAHQSAIQTNIAVLLNLDTILGVRLDLLALPEETEQA